MAARGKNQSVDDEAIRALLKRYGCPIPYHRLRARFMGNIATPDMNASPVREIRAVWNDDLPIFEDQGEAEAFFGALLQGMWNGLSAHQKRSDPFKLVRVKTAPASHEYLGRLAKVRRECSVTRKFAVRDTYNCSKRFFTLGGTGGLFSGRFSKRTKIAC